VELVDHLFELVTVTRDPVTSLCSIAFPSDREIRAMFHIKQIREMVPNSAAPIWSELLQRARSYAKQLPAPRSVIAPSVPRAPVPQTAVGDEAIVRSMSSADVLRQIVVLNLSPPEPHPTNGGITAMRRRNVLYSYIRRGGRLNTGAEPKAVTPRLRSAAKWVVS
jgi:hypothetical protein